MAEWNLLNGFDLKYLKCSPYFYKWSAIYRFFFNFQLFFRLNNANKWSCDRLTEDADFGKKRSFFQMKLILILAGM